jgi:hypothetical protein
MTSQVLFVSSKWSIRPLLLANYLVKKEKLTARQNIDEKNTNRDAILAISMRESADSRNKPIWSWKGCIDAEVPKQTKMRLDCMFFLMPLSCIIKPSFNPRKGNFNNRRSPSSIKYIMMSWCRISKL